MWPGAINSRLSFPQAQKSATPPTALRPVTANAGKPETPVPHKTIKLYYQYQTVAENFQTKGTVLTLFHGNMTHKFDFGIRGELGKTNHDNSRKCRVNHPVKIRANSSRSYNNRRKTRQ